MRDWKKLPVKFILMAWASSIPIEAASADFHYPPVRLDCHLENSYTLSFFKYQTNNEKRKRYNGSVGYGPFGEGGSYEFDEIIFEELPENALRLNGTPILKTDPTFELHLERPKETYTGVLNLTYPNGRSEHLKVKFCAEYKLCEDN